MINLRGYIDRLPFRKMQCASYHEAGHAVMMTAAHAWLFDSLGGFEHIKIGKVRGTNLLGGVVGPTIFGSNHAEMLRQSFLNGDEEAVHALENIAFYEIACYLSGPYAETLFFRNRDVRLFDDLRRKDFQKAAQILEWLQVSIPGASADAVHMQCRDMVMQNETAIRLLADAIRKRKVMSFEEAFEVFRYYMIPMPARPEAPTATMLRAV